MAPGRRRSWTQMEHPIQLELNFEAPPAPQVQAVASVHRLDTFREAKLKEERERERARLIEAILASAPSLPPEAEAM